MSFCRGHGWDLRRAIGKVEGRSALQAQPGPDLHSPQGGCGSIEVIVTCLTLKVLQEYQMLRVTFQPCTLKLFSEELQEVGVCKVSLTFS